jgi:membrane dipeptidase
MIRTTDRSIAGNPGLAAATRALLAELTIVNGLDASDFDDGLIRSMRAGGIHANVVTGLRGGVRPLMSLDSPHLRYVRERSDELALAQTVADIEQARHDGRIAIIFAWQVADGIGENDEMLEGFHRLGLRSSGLSYNVGNFIGSGCVDPAQGPLSRFGEQVVERMQELRIVVDIGGHCSEATSFDVLRIARGPVVCSHTNPRALRDTPRNMTDELMLGIARTGGVVGITTFNFFLAGDRQAGIGDFLDHIDYSVRLLGDEHVGLGLDQIIGRQIAGPVDQRKFPPTAYPPMYEDWIYVAGLEDFSGVPLITAGLIERGYSQESIARIMGGNWLRVWKEVWGA